MIEKQRPIRASDPFVNLSDQMLSALHIRDPSSPHSEIHRQTNELRDRNEVRRRRGGTLLPFGMAEYNCAAVHPKKLGSNLGPTTDNLGPKPCT
jgi:hypothetical protein